MPFYFYLARCSDNSLYSGSCVDLKNREKTHNDGKGAKYTRSRRPVRIVYSEKFATRSEAMKREAEVKKWTRAKKINLVKCGHLPKNK
ncbi:MAG: GIY-YIG nuclease family protein [Patescibacteria group bacterium]